ncbi:IS200/IS605 family transposase [Rhodohalobacter sp. SW132]|uniref:IS200/IS605 family transposase n=1 Tax=Rhodohalobacter sp. SW132 TaxID=2293433 RepID=UPI000E25E511|nr:IS200/IS605 family transposase [Rhodohalobacter sp. SW132]REL37567.1 IS200/IS605 family transposase [Rhodohalobacter sp. SW132]
MSTHTQILYQIIFSTKLRTPTLLKDNREELFKYIWGILKNNKCHLYRINGVEDHLHIVTHVHPSISVSSLVKDIKVSCNSYIKSNLLFPEFTAWQEGYSAFTYSIKEKNRLIEYVKKQETHHKTISYREELITLLQEHRVEFNEKYLM